MDDALRVVFAMNTSVWAALTDALDDLTEEEICWQPLPRANTINLIVRHLRIEAEWHVDSLEHGKPMPTVATAPSQEAIDAVSDNFQENFKALVQYCTRFLEILKRTTLNTLRERTAAAYGKMADSEANQYLLGYHHATHLAMHCGQIRSLRNLYRKTRGAPLRFFPDNPTFPR
jgi:hypothetical protein